MPEGKPYLRPRPGRRRDDLEGEGPDRLECHKKRTRSDPTRRQKLEGQPASEKAEGASSDAAGPGSSAVGLEKGGDLVAKEDEGLPPRPDGRRHTSEGNW